MARKKGIKEKKQPLEVKEKASNGVNYAENNSDVILEKIPDTEEGIKNDLKSVIDVSKQNKETGSSNEKNGADSEVDNSEKISKSSVKLRKKAMVKTNDSRNSHDKNHIENEPEEIVKQDILEKKPVSGKRGRKKMVNVDENKQLRGSKLVGSTKQPVNKQKNDITSYFSVKDELNEMSEETNLPVINEEKELKNETAGSEQPEELKIENKKTVPPKKKKLQINRHMKKTNGVDIPEVSKNAAESVSTIKNSRKRKNENSNDVNTDKKISSQSEAVPSHSADGKNLKELRVLIKRNKQTEAAAASSVDSHSKETSTRGRKKNVDAPSDGGSEGTKGKKRKKDDDDDDFKKKSKPKEPIKSKSSSKVEKIPDITALDFSNNAIAPNGKVWNLKLSSWNVNGIRAWLEKNGISYLYHEKPDVLCIQETKCSDDKMPEEMKNIEGYHSSWHSGDKDGYSGVGLISKEKPINIEFGIGVEEHDKEGRVITAEFDKFYLVAAYVPNAGRGLVRLNYRMEWDKDFRAYLKKLDSKKPVVLCGDLNVAHEEIDLAHPKGNKKNAGFTKEEREGFSTLLSEGFIDTFRHLYPDAKGAYTFWTYMMNARAKNVGWRLDYFVVSERFAENVADHVIRKDVYGSDHCPITFFLSV